MRRSFSGASYGAVALLGPFLMTTGMQPAPLGDSTADPAKGQVATQLDETLCIARLKELRWARGPYCPYCGHRKIYNLNTTRLPLCGACKNTFSVKVGTIFQGSPLPLAKWFTAIRLVTNPEARVTAARLAAAMQVGQTTAWESFAGCATRQLLPRLTARYACETVPASAAPGRGRRPQ